MFLKKWIMKSNKITRIYDIWKKKKELLYSSITL